MPEQEFQYAPEPKRKLQYIAANRVVFIEGGLAGLKKFLVSGEWKKAECDAYVLIRPDVNGYYSFWAPHFHYIIRWSIGVRLAKMDERMIAEAFDIHEHTRVAQLTPGDKPSDRSVVLDQGRIIGAWVELVPLLLSPPPGGRAEEEEPPAASYPPAAPRRSAAGRAVDSVRRMMNRRSAGSAKMDETARVTEEDVVRRTPHMDLSVEGAVKPDTEFNVLVYTDKAPARLGETSQDIVINAPRDVTRLEVLAWLVVSEHFLLKENALKTLVIDRAVDRSGSLVFPVRVKKAMADVLQAKITAYFSYNGRASGKVERLIPVVLNGNTRRGEPALRPSAVTQLSSPPPTGGEPSFEIDGSAKQPDLSIKITNPERDLRRLRCLVQTPLLEDYKKGVTEDWFLASTTPEIVTQFMQDFTDENRDNQERFLSLRGAGISLFEQAPPIFQKVFWELVDSGKPLRSIYVVSEDPFTPWELMVPTRRLPNGDLDERNNPLGIDYHIGRWIPKDFLSPRQRIVLLDSFVVAPQYPGNQALPKANEEADFVCRKFAGRKIAPAEIGNIDAELKQMGRSLLHFVCHGASSDTPGKQIIVLEGGSKTLDSVQLRSMSGVKQACSSKKPLIFLNACEVGRQVPALTGVGGFAESFIQLGASAVIAPLWSVKDDIAHEVAVEFYEAILANPRLAFAEVLQKIRTKAYQPGAAQGEDTYAAYCFYGDPLAWWDKA